MKLHIRQREHPVDAHCYTKKWTYKSETDNFSKTNERTSLLLAQLLNGRYIRVLMCFSPLHGFAKTLPFSFNEAIVKPK